MTRDAAVFLLLVLAGAVWLVLQLSLSVRVARAAQLSRWARWLGWLPPLTPLLAWRAGARGLSLAWLLDAALYALLRGIA
jgi:hypothetical protein